MSSAERVFRAMGHKQRHTQKTYVPTPHPSQQKNILNQHASSFENDSGRLWFCASILLYPFMTPFPVAIRFD